MPPTDVNQALKLLQKWGSNGVGWGSGCECERRIEVFVKIQEKNRARGGGGGVRTDVKKKLKN